ncbi:hypothetical protein [Bacillus cereus]|uniref:hypothetical protein n=1 Tax=Bacillus cereus TaxID=1396 RepID=UPI000994B7BE|nr:hypothetical protein [Bacillus cereus]
MLAIPPSEGMGKETQFRNISIFENKMKALAHENGLAYDSTYFHYCNTICPSCHEEMKVINGIVQNVGSIGVGVMEKLGFVVPYAVCVQCNEQSETQTELEKEENSDRILEYVILRMMNIDL